MAQADMLGGTRSLALAFAAAALAAIAVAAAPYPDTTGTQISHAPGYTFGSNVAGS